MEAVGPLIQKFSPLPVPPFLLNQKVYDSMAETPSMDSLTQPMRASREALSHGSSADRRPAASWTFTRKRSSGEKLPQTIAHRGYKAKHPENTMGAFRGAVEAKANAIETDIHLTKDDVVVLSHDATLKRCYGKDEKMIECTWDYISRQRTIAAPHQPMPRLFDLLQFLASPGLEDTWLLLDIKLDNDADTLMRLIAQTIQSVAPNNKSWDQRIVLGCWAAKYLPLCSTYLPTFAISHIGFSIPYARQFLSVPNVSFNILQKTLIVPYFGARFLRDAKAKGRPVFVWTVNEESMMTWSISNGLDGVITDDPEKFLEVCEDWERGHRKVDISWGQWMMIFWINFMVLIFGSIFWWKYGGTQKRKEAKTRKEIGFPSKQERGSQ